MGPCRPTAVLTLLNTRLRPWQADLRIAQPQLNYGLVMAQVKWRALKSGNGNGLWKGQDSPPSIVVFAVAQSIKRHP